MILPTDEEIRDAIYKTRWEVISHERRQSPHTNMNVHALYINDEMFGYILDKPEDKDWFSIYKGDREYAHSTIAKHNLDEAKQALLDMAITGMDLPLKRDEIAKVAVKKVVEWIKQNGRTGYRYTNDDTKVITWEYDTECDNEIMIDLGDWHALLEEAK